MKTINLLPMLALSAAALIAGCGGNSSDGNNTINVSGQWKGALTKVSDNCAGSTAPQTLGFTHAVNQNEEAVTLTDGNGITFLGNVVSDDGFSVDATGAGAVGGMTCSVPQANQLRYKDIANNSDQTAAVEITVTCSGGVGCGIDYTGTASRAVGAITTTPTPSGSVAGGCTAITEDTASGSYSGDGGCGLSEAVYDANGSTVILEPFGANGATSFTIDDSNASSATSNVSDLTIMGETGYSCSITCSPPLTFTVSCFKEGGTTCAEKF